MKKGYCSNGNNKHMRNQKAIVQRECFAKNCEITKSIGCESTNNDFNGFI